MLRGLEPVGTIDGRTMGSSWPGNNVELLKTTPAIGASLGEV